MARTRRHITTRELANIRALRAKGETFASIGRAIGRCPNTVKFYLDERFAERLRKDNLARYYRNKAKRARVSTVNNDSVVSTN